LLEIVKQVPGVAVELERVVTRCSQCGMEVAAQGTVPPIFGEEVGSGPEPTPSMEVHTCFEIAADKELADLDRFPAELEEIGLCHDSVHASTADGAGHGGALPLLRRGTEV